LEKQIGVLKGTPELAEITKLAQTVSVGGNPRVLHVWLVDSLSDDKEELPLGESVSNPITPIEEMDLLLLLSMSNPCYFMFGLVAL
jgi:hypothetical protein